MNKREKEFLQYTFNAEENVLHELAEQYEAALDDINEKIMILQSNELTQSKIYQLQYQQALKGQIEGILEKLHSDEYSTIQQFLEDSYTNGFVGTMYSIHGQGIPLMMPIDQKAAVKAIITDSKISKSLYDALGVDTSGLKKAIRKEITRGIASNMSNAEIARNISNVTKAPLSRAKTIVRTENHRIQQSAAYDAQQSSKAMGADVVKQWDSTLDGRTRPTHRQLDGQIREIDEPFEANGMKAMFPGDFGDPAEDCNCRCVSLTRAKWALDDDELQTLKDRAKFFGLDKTGDFEDFKSKYLNAVQNVASQATISPVYTGIIQAGGKVKTVGGIDCAVEVKDYGFTDGAANGIMKTVPATIYTTPDGTQFVYPKRYNKSNQALTPDDAIATWYRVPENVRAKIQKTVEVVDYYNPQDSYWRKRYKNFTHSYAVGGDKITIFRSNYHNLDYLAETYCHEGGHYIDYTLPGTSRTNRYCNQADWQAAMAKDLQTSGKKSWRAYGENSALEDFADSVGYYTMDNANFVATFPERSKLLANILK